MHSNCRAFAAVLGALLGGVALADDPKADVERQKTTIAANLKKAGLENLAFAETNDLLVYTAVPEAKSKAFAEAVQKVYATARKELKVEEKDKPWPGKLAVIAIAEPKQFGNYVRVVEQRRPEKGVNSSTNIRSDTPYVIDSVDLGEKLNEAELLADVATMVAAAVLNKKAGTGVGTARLPEWVQVGFGRSMIARSGDPAKLAAFRARYKAAVLGTKKGTPPRLYDVWSGAKTKDSDLVAASFVEYLLYGPEPAKFLQFAQAFKPTDNMPAPGVEGVLTMLEWTTDGLEPTWRAWVSKVK